MIAPPAEPDWEPARYARDAGFVAALGAPLIDLLAPRREERVLDLGCGDGTLTRLIIARGARVVGVDSSKAQIAAARTAGIDAEIMDGQALRFDAEFDAILSNAALHWMRKPDAVIDGMWRALKPGGRIAAEFGGHGNVARIADALAAALGRRGYDWTTADSWYFPTAAAYRAKLEARGFSVGMIELYPRPTPVPAGMAAWLELFAAAILAPLDAVDRAAVIDEVVEALRPALYVEDTGWWVDYVRLKFLARKPV